MDRYKSFDELNKHEHRGVDYDIRIRGGYSGVTVMAPHGGAIEPGTSALAEGIAGSDHSLYCFNGIKATGNGALHISSERFDEPEGMEMAAAADLVLAVHGCNETGQVIFVGGRDVVFKQMLSEALRKAGFPVDDNPRLRLKGIKSTNLCNRGRTGQGVQIELSRGMRRQMFEDPSHEAGGRKQAYDDFVVAVRNALDHYLAQAGK